MGGFLFWFKPLLSKGILFKILKGRKRMELIKEYGTYFLMEEKKNGRYINLPYNVIEGERTELTEKVRNWLRNENCPYVLKQEDDTEDLLDDISGHLEEGYLDMPIDTSYDYFIRINKNVIVHVDAADEYLGHGDYQLYACINGLIATPTVTEEEVKEAVQWIKKFE